MSPSQTRTKPRRRHTLEGLPLDAGAFLRPTAADAADPGPARRIDCRVLPPPLVAARPPSAAPKASSPGDDDALPTPPAALRPGPAVGSLIDDDDDDDIVDYFGGGVTGGPAVLPADDDVARPRSSPWDVRERHVRPVPSFHPLERSRVVVAGAAAGVVAARVAAALQARGTAAAYDAPRAKVDCVSADGVEFRVRLYRGRAGLVVEVQRRAGFALRYMQDVYAILDAAAGKDLETALQPSHSPPERATEMVATH